MPIFTLGIREELLNVYEVDAPTKEQAEKHLLTHLNQTAKEREALSQDDDYWPDVVLHYSAVPAVPRIESIIVKIEDVAIKHSH